MTVLVIIIHVIVCTALIILVLIQRGRGGGLVESFQGVESLFGTKTNTFLTRTTTVLSILFFITCLSLALLSLRQSKSLLMGVTPHKMNAVKKTIPLGAPPAAGPAVVPAPQPPVAETKTQGAQTQVP